MIRVRLDPPSRELLKLEPCSLVRLSPQRQARLITSGDVVIRRVGNDANRAQDGKVVVEIIRSLSVYAVMCKDQRSEMRVTSDVCTSVTSNQLTRSKLVYVARAREIHSCTAPPTDTLAVEVSRLTLDAGAPSSRIEGKKMVDKDVLFGGSNAE